MWIFGTYTYTLHTSIKKCAMCMQKNCIRNKNVAWCECVLQRIVYKGVEGGLCIMNHLFFFLIWGARYILCVSAYKNGFTNTKHIYGGGGAAAASSADIATQQLVDTTDNATCAVRGVHRNQVYSYISVWIKIFNIINQNIYSSSLRLCCFASLFGVCVCLCLCMKWMHAFDPNAHGSARFLFSLALL